MELTQLRYFTAVADTKNFTEAAARLHVSQPALSYQIKRLENELGARLFDRTSRKVSLTVDGHTFLPLAQMVLFKVEEATSVMEDRLGVMTGSVRLGCIPSAAAYIVPSVLASFNRNFPGVTVSLLESGAAALERAVHDGSADLAIVADPISPETLDVTLLLTESLLLVVPSHHRLASQDSVSLTELTEEPFIMLGGTFTLGPHVTEACRRAGFEPKVAYETGSLDSVKSFVRHELGISVLPKMAFRPTDDDTLVRVPFVEPLTRDLNLIRNRDRYASVATRSLMVHIRTSALSNQSPATRALMRE